MKLRLFLDEDVHAALAAALRTQENRCLVTFNVGDFVRLHNRWMDEGREHAGVIVSKQLPVCEMLRRLLALLQKEGLPLSATFYLCGPTGFMDAVTSGLRQLGVQVCAQSFTYGLAVHLQVPP